MALAGEVVGEEVTTDEIASAAGVSKRTFFRYFASKEAVVVRFLTDLGAGIHRELAARPAGERPSLALRSVLSGPLAACADHSDRALRVVRLILRTPALHARLLERQGRWREGLAAELARRPDLGPDHELYPEPAAGMALTAFNTVLHRWSDSDGTADPEALTEQAFALIAPALDGTRRQT
ncbi:acyl-CoA-like ligand-binding transcription factor [Streptomyces violaceoruber]|uniref:TetR family transcriptional regulator n=1 Tax=Streptomyces violaceoruber TaxID=1935 RepID=A0ACD4WZ37_STRVN|nr:TetR family transcriptional regulator [Streptomyces violaceoruber]BDD69865.1 TetR family transcriptional regulator [Streptomyces coelicolor]